MFYSLKISEPYKNAYTHMLLPNLIISLFYFTLFITVIQGMVFCLFLVSYFYVSMGIKGACVGILMLRMVL